MTMIEVDPTTNEVLNAPPIEPYVMRPHDLLVNHPALAQMLTACEPREWVVVLGDCWSGPYPNVVRALHYVR